MKQIFDCLNVIVKFSISIIYIFLLSCNSKQKPESLNNIVGDQEKNTNVKDKTVSCLDVEYKDRDINNNFSDNSFYFGQLSIKCNVYGYQFTEELNEKHHIFN